MAEVPKLIANLPPDVWVVAMQEFNGMLILATSRGVYRFLHGAFVAIPMIHDPKEVPTWVMNR